MPREPKRRLSRPRRRNGANAASNCCGDACQPCGRMLITPVGGWRSSRSAAHTEAAASSAAGGAASSSWRSSKSAAHAKAEASSAASSGEGTGNHASTTVSGSRDHPVKEPVPRKHHVEGPHDCDEMLCHLIAGMRNVCIQPHCTREPWNGESGHYCCRQCRDFNHIAGAHWHDKVCNRYHKKHSQTVQI